MTTEEKDLDLDVEEDFKKDVDFKLKLSKNQKEKDLQEACKILNINDNSFMRSRNYIIKSNFYNSEDKIKFLDIIESLYTKQKRVLKTSSYDNKVYCQLFFDDFLEFLNTCTLSTNEFKVLLAIYSILHKTNTYGNVLLNFSNQAIADKTKIDYSNINKVITSLVKKEILIKKEDRRDKSLFLNYKYFFRGSKLNYDQYKDKYDAEINNDFVDEDKFNEELLNNLEIKD